MKIIPNCITLSRIILSFALLFVKPLGAAFYLIYLVCGICDILDGFLARKLGAESKLGAKLDSFADLIMVSVLFFLLYPMIKPGPIVVIWIIFIFVIRLTSIVITFKKYKTIAVLHTYANKITGFILFIFPLLLPIGHSTMLIYVICGVASVSSIEELLIHLRSSQLQLNKPSMFKK